MNRRLLPANLQIEEGRFSAVEWVDRSQVRFTDPFFDATVSRAKNTGLEALTDLSALLRFLKDQDAPQPAGFIFHATRCGSTLVSQILAQDESNLVLAEPDFLQNILWSAPAVQLGERMELVVASLRAAARAMRGSEQRLFIKFGLGLGWLHFFKRLYPNTPCIFVYRHPVEILQSNIEQPPQWLPKGLSRDEMRAVLIKTLEHKFSTIISSAKGARLLVDHAEIDDDLPRRLSSVFGWSPTPDSLSKMRAAMSRYSKDPSQSWPSVQEQEVRMGHAELTNDLRLLCDQYLILNQIRRGLSN